ncbi:GntR family transcriptional regulator [Flagellimonas flava]|uniref:Transcriptional regulator, GntR family n=1 Tax=Flagellimonas flava TaxID=570519 RepID=A0A1M5JYD0_9FLAO|nr:GntR family transcriptional regulator [Allomuricauda flava]SHG45395.1 transcriptional regulator, GntR family [Allomuricauda flava]
MTLIDVINQYQIKYDLTKHEHLVLGILEAIDIGVLTREDQLPSINKMAEELGYARKTIVGAYEDLKGRGLVESKKAKGYFIVSQETKMVRRVALLLFSFQRFQEEFYNAFRKELGERFKIDVFFHHNNLSVFENTLLNIKSKYGFYVVAPIPNPKIKSLLESFAPDKLLIVDRFFSMHEKYSFISQEFEDSTYDKLLQLLPKIRKYELFVLLADEKSALPIEVVRGFNKFLSENNVLGTIKTTYDSSILKKNHLYFASNDSFLWDILKDCSDRGYVLGKDVGVLSHDDHIIKKFISGGITTISTDFSEMGVQSARYVKTNTRVRQITPSYLIDRGSV